MFLYLEFLIFVLARARRMGVNDRQEILVEFTIT